MKKVKVKFVHVHSPKDKWGIPKFNGDETARILEATIEEQEIEGYDLISSEMCTAHGNSTGTLLYFKLRENS